MAVYVDRLMNHGWVLRGRNVPNCHMFADSIEELHAMAETIGMKRSWFQDKPRFPHYDLTASRRESAIAHGAIDDDLLNHENFKRIRSVAVIGGST